MYYCTVISMHRFCVCNGGTRGPRLVQLHDIHKSRFPNPSQIYLRTGVTELFLHVPRKATKIDLKTFLVEISFAATTFPYPEKFYVALCFGAFDYTLGEVIVRFVAVGAGTAMLVPEFDVAF
jgi:hypothetical protein